MDPCTEGIESTAECADIHSGAFIAMVGADVTLPCESENPPYYCLWRIPGNSTPVIPELDHDKYQLAGEEDCTMIVKSVNYTDDGRYECIAVTEEIIVKPASITVASK